MTADRTHVTVGLDGTDDEGRVAEERVDEERVVEGRVVDLRDRDLDPEAVAAAVRASDDEITAGTRASDEPAGGAHAADASGDDGRHARDGAERGLRIACPRPSTVHEHVGCVRPSMSVRVRTALAAAARSRGATAPHAEDIAAVRERLAALPDPDSPDCADARERLAGTDTAVDRLRERVATLRGRIQAGREAGRDVSDLEDELAAATRELSERETERAAAREALDRARRDARAIRDVRERRRRLEDRLANLERAARASLVDEFRDEFAAALATVPGGDVDASVLRSDADRFDVDDVSAALAIGRVAALRAPVVLACDRFDRPREAVRWFDAPVIRV